MHCCKELGLLKTWLFYSCNWQKKKKKWYAAPVSHLWWATLVGKVKHVLTCVVSLCVAFRAVQGILVDKSPVFALTPSPSCLPQPYCDGAHKTKAPSIAPLRFSPDKDKTVMLCACKETKNAPYCDGSHFKVIFRDVLKSVKGVFKWSAFKRLGYGARKLIAIIIKNTSDLSLLSFVCKPQENSLLKSASPSALFPVIYHNCFSSLLTDTLLFLCCLDFRVKNIFTVSQECLGKIKDFTSSSALLLLVYWVIILVVRFYRVFSCVLK